jgi:hypothetical protein
MNVELGARVRTSDGEEVGTIDAAAGYPAGRAAWPVGGAGMDTTPAGASEGQGGVWREIEAILDRQHFENAVDGEGSEDRSHDGERIGAVERLSFDEESGRLAELVVRSGFIVVEELAVPARLVAAVDDGVVVLGLDAAALAAWADLTEDDEVWSRDGVHLGTIRRWGMDYLIIRSLEGGRWLRVPMTAVARREDRRIVLHVEAAEALRWDTLAGAAAGPAEPGR